MKRLFLGLVLVVAGGGCKPAPLSSKGAERACSQICSNSVLKLTRIKEIQHKASSTNAVVRYEHLNEEGKVEEQLLFLVYNGGWDIDSAKQASYANKWISEHPLTRGAN